MIAGDAAVLDELCSDELIYTHSKGDHDDKRSYLHKVGSRYFTYLEITHPADRILVVDSAALVTGRMTARVSVGPAKSSTSTIAISRSGCASTAPGSSSLTSQPRSSTPDIHRALACGSDGATLPCLVAPRATRRWRGARRVGEAFGGPLARTVELLERALTPMPRSSASTRSPLDWNKGLPAVPHWQPAFRGVCPHRARQPTTFLRHECAYDARATPA